MALKLIDPDFDKNKNNAEETMYKIRLRNFKKDDENLLEDSGKKEKKDKEKKSCC